MLDYLVIFNSDTENPNEESLQAFLNRQKMGVLDLAHQDLKVLTLKIESDNVLAAVLKQQLNLRKLSCGSIGSASFEELLKMRKLEDLTASFTGQMRGELENLRVLKISGDCSIFQQVAFPKLKTLEVKEDREADDEFIFVHSLGPETVMALSRSAKNLEEISILIHGIDFLPLFLENFPQLHSLKVEPLTDGALNFQPPSRPNLGLKELIIHRQVYGHVTPDSTINQTIALCPNLERISLSDVVFTKHEILGLILSHPHLTHFSFGSESYEAPPLLQPTRQRHRLSGSNIDGNNQHLQGFSEVQLLELVQHL